MGTVKEDRYTYIDVRYYPYGEDKLRSGVTKTVQLPENASKTECEREKAILLQEVAAEQGVLLSTRRYKRSDITFQNGDVMQGPREEERDIVYYAHRLRSVQGMIDEMRAGGRGNLRGFHHLLSMAGNGITHIAEQEGGSQVLLSAKDQDVMVLESGTGARLWPTSVVDSKTILRKKKGYQP